MPSTPNDAVGARRWLGRLVGSERLGRPVHASTGGDAELVAAALATRVGYLLGDLDLTAASVGAGVLQTLPAGPTTRAATQRTLAGFLSEHAGRAAALQPGLLLGVAGERALATDAVVLALLAQAAEDRPLARLAIAGPCAAGLDDDRLGALVDPRVVGEVVTLAEAAERTLWRPLATAQVSHVGPSRWQLGDHVVAVRLGGRRDVRGGPADLAAPTHTWLARHERLVSHGTPATRRGAAVRDGAR